MTDSIYAWSQTAIDNEHADLTVNWAEFQDPDTVNDSARSMMVRIAQYLADASPTRTSTGAANTYAVTSAAAGAAYRNGELIAFQTHQTNTGPATLNVNGRGAKPLRAYSGTSLNAGEVQTNQALTAFYRSASDEFLIMGSGASVNAMTEGLLTQSIVGRLPRVGDPVLSLAPTPATGRLRLLETSQQVLKSSYPELANVIQGWGFPWGSTATHFTLPPAAGYYLRFAATSTAVDTAGARAAGVTQSDQNKTHTHDLANHTHDLSSHTHTGGSHTHDLGNHTHGLGSFAASETAAGGHVHTITGTTASGGVDHTHSGGGTTGTESAGHTHLVSGNTVAAGAHNHDVRYSTASDVATTGGGARVTAITAGGAAGAGNTAALAVADHTHSVSITSAVNPTTHTHDYAFTTGGSSAYLHSHTLTGTSDTIAAHTHVITLSGTSGTPSTNTSGASSANTTGAPSNNTSGLPSINTSGSSGGDEVRVKNISMHVDVIASSALTAGTLGTFGFAFVWDSGISATDPGTGRVRGNSAVLSSITALYISETDQWGVDLSSVLSAVGQLAVLKISGIGGPANVLVLRVAGAITDNGAFRTIPVTVVGNSGAFANSDSVAIEWTAPGATGPAGPAGGGLSYTFDVSTTDANPGAGMLRGNNASFSSVSTIYINTSDSDGNDLTSWLDSLDDSTSPDKGRLHIALSSNPGALHIFALTSITVATGYRKLTVTHVSGSVSYAASDAVRVIYIPKGDKGDTGTPGTNGNNGTNGSNGTDSGLRWSLEASTTMAAPASGGIRFNNATLSSITALAINANCGETGNPSVLTYLQAWDDSSNTSNRGTLVIKKSSAPQNYIIATINAALTDNTSWVQIPVTVSGSSGTFAATDVVSVAWSRTGDRGASGAGTGDLLAVNNLSDVASVATSRSNLGLGTMATQNAAGVSIGGGSITNITDLAIADGGTGASDAATARTNLGLGTMATQAASAVAITGGSVTNITDITVADGGTGASTAAGARTNLGLGDIATQSAASVTITGGSILGVTTLREKITSSRTYYVRADGNDSNTGLADTAGGAYLTVQRAVDEVAKLDAGNLIPIVQVRSGTFGAVTMAQPLGSIKPILRGDTTTPANVVLTGVTATGPMINWLVEGFLIQPSSSFGLLADLGAKVTLGNMRWKTASFAHIYAAGRSSVIYTGSSTIDAATSGYHVFADAGTIVFQGTTITHVQATAYSSFAASYTDSFIDANVTVVANSCTGKRYEGNGGDIRLNGVTLPGTVSGTATNGGRVY